MAIEVSLELGDFTQRSRRDDLFESDKVRVPAAVLVHGQLLAALLRDLAQFICFCGGGHERLLHDDVLAGLQGGFAHAKVRLGDAGDDYDFYAVIFEGLVDVSVGFGARVVLFCVVVGLW